MRRGVQPGDPQLAGTAGMRGVLGGAWRGDGVVREPHDGPSRWELNTELFAKRANGMQESVLFFKIFIKRVGGDGGKRRHLLARTVLRRKRGSEWVDS